MAYFPGSLVSISGLPGAAPPVASALREGVQPVELNGDKAQLLHFDKEPLCRCGWTVKDGLKFKDMLEKNNMLGVLVVFVLL